MMSSQKKTSGQLRPTSARHFVLTWLCLAATIAYICRNSIGVAESTIRNELHLSEETMSWVMSGFFLTYAFGQIPAGWFANRMGSRKAIPLFSITWSLATGVMSLLYAWPGLLAARLVNGAAQAGLFPACVNSMSHWFPNSRRAFVSGTLASFMSIGGAVGVALTGTLIVSVGWRTTFAAYSLLGILWAVGFYWWFRDFPNQHRSVNSQELNLIGGGSLETADKEQGATPWLRLYSSPALWWICGQHFCRAAGQIFFASWFATYLQETRDVSVAESGFLNSLPLVAIVLGSFIGGTISDFVLARSNSRWLARTGVAVCSMLVCAAFVLCAYYIRQPLLAVLVISLGSFFAAIGGPCAYSVSIDMGGRHVAIAFATMNMIGNLGAFLFIRLVPNIIEWTGSWDGVLVLFGALYLVAAVFWALLNPNRQILDYSLVGRAE